VKIKRAKIEKAEDQRCQYKKAETKKAAVFMLRPFMISILVLHRHHEIILPDPASLWLNTLGLHHRRPCRIGLQQTRVAPASATAPSPEAASRASLKDAVSKFDGIINLFIMPWTIERIGNPGQANNRYKFNIIPVTPG
jgi:hypothetical protein